MVRWGILGVIVILAMTRWASGAPFEFHHVQVLGTELHLYFDASGPRDAERAEQVVLQEIDRLEKIFSSYDPESELSRWNRAAMWTKVSPELSEVLVLSERWFNRSHGTFQPGVELATRIWRDAEKRQTLPTDESLEACAAQLRTIGWQWSEDHQQVLANPARRLSFNAIAKGWIIDAVIQELKKQSGLNGGAVAIGGDLRVFGTMERPVGIRPPADDLISQLVETISVKDAAVATSSGAFRGVTIQQRRYSHLIDPRTARPVSHVRSVTVMAPSAADADALATICSVLNVQESLALVDSIPDASCLILDAEGNSHRSTRWPNRISPVTRMTAGAEAVPVWNGGMELEVDFEIHQAKKGGRYRRPYVAIWVEDQEGFPVRTLLLWVQTSGPGPRWIPDLKRWYKSDQLRKLVDDVDLVETITEATRKPGTYSVIWNGEDDHQKLVEPGEYTLFIEAAREHGTYQLMRKKVTLKDQSLDETLEDNAEIKAASLHYRKKSPAH